jgi:hypothetical protein
MTIAIWLHCHILNSIYAHKLLVSCNLLALKSTNHGLNPISPMKTLGTKSLFGDNQSLWSLWHNLSDHAANYFDESSFGLYCPYTTLWALPDTCINLHSQARAWSNILNFACFFLLWSTIVGNLTKGLAVSHTKASWLSRFDWMVEWGCVSNLYWLAPVTALAMIRLSLKCTCCLIVFHHIC